MRLSKGDETLEIGLRLEDVRKNLGYSQRMMANELDVSVQQYQKYISGESTISADRLLMLYKKTPFDVKYVITGEKEEDSKGALGLHTGQGIYGQGGSNGPQR